MVAIHLCFRPEEKDLLQLQRFLVVPQAVPPVLCRPAKASEVAAAEGHVLLEGDLDADQLLLGVGPLNVLKVFTSIVFIQWLIEHSYIEKEPRSPMAPNSEPVCPSISQIQEQVILIARAF